MAVKLVSPGIYSIFMIFVVVILVIFAMLITGPLMFGFEDKPLIGASSWLEEVSFEVAGIEGSIYASLINAKIQVKVDSTAIGTLLTVNDWWIFALGYYDADEVILTVRTMEQKEEWDNYIRSKREEIKTEREQALAPRDVSPPWL